MHHFDTPTPPRLKIELRAGTVRVTGADTTETAIELRPRRAGKAGDDAVAATVIEQRGDEVVVLGPKHLGLIGRSVELDLTVTVPHGAALHVATGSADVTATGRFATTSVATGSGDVELDQLTDSARVRSGSGRVRISSVAGDLSATTGSGDLTIGAVAGSAIVVTGSGDVRVDQGGSALEVKSGSGDVTIGTAPADVRVRTGSGDIGIARVAAGEVRAKAASGDIHTGVQAGTAAWLDVRSASGRVSSDLESAGEPTGDQARVRLQLETSSGDIELVRV